MAKRNRRNYLYIQKRKPGQPRRKLKKQNDHQPLQQALDKLPITQQWVSPIFARKYTPRN